MDRKIPKSKYFWHLFKYITESAPQTESLDQLDVLDSLRGPGSFEINVNVVYKRIKGARWKQIKGGKGVKDENRKEILLHNFRLGSYESGFFTYAMFKEWAEKNKPKDEKGKPDKMFSFDVLEKKKSDAMSFLLSEKVLKEDKFRYTDGSNRKGSKTVYFVDTGRESLKKVYEIIKSTGDRAMMCSFLKSNLLLNSSFFFVWQGVRTEIIDKAYKILNALDQLDVKKMDKSLKVYRKAFPDDRPGDDFYKKQEAVIDYTLTKKSHKHVERFKKNVRASFFLPESLVRAWLYSPEIVDMVLNADYHRFEEYGRVRVYLRFIEEELQRKDLGERERGELICMLDLTRAVLQLKLGWPVSLPNLFPGRKASPSVMRAT